MTQSLTPRLCIGLPVYNGARYLAQAIESLLSQTFSDFRLIIADNASTDGTEEICRSYGRQDARIAYHRGAANRGAAWNFKRVVQLADAEYFKWTAHDDLYAPEYVQRCVDVLDAHPQVILVYTKSHIIDEHGAFLRPYDNRVQATAATPYERFKDVLRNLGLCNMQVGVIRHGVLRQTRPHGAYPGSDYVLLAELALRGPLHEVDEPLFFRRDHPERPARVYRSSADLAVWFDPANAGRIQPIRWITLIDYLRAIARVPMPAGQRLRCAYLMAKWCRWNSQQLRHELAQAVAGVARRRLRPSHPDPRARVA